MGIGIVILSARRSIHVQPESRSSAAVRALTGTRERRAWAQGCYTFAGGCEQKKRTNALEFQRCPGFQNAARMTCFTKKLS